MLRTREKIMKLLQNFIAASLAFLVLSVAQAAPLTDDEIVSVVATANIAEMNAGKLAQSNAYKEKVRRFAELMVADHRKMDAEMGKLAVKLKLNPTPSSLSKTLKADAEEGMENLKIAPKGPIFDKEYMAGQVAMHQQVLETFDDELIPNAKNSELKNMLEKARRKIESHLEHAMQLHEEITANI